MSHNTHLYTRGQHTYTQARTQKQHIQNTHARTHTQRARADTDTHTHAHGHTHTTRTHTYIPIHERITIQTHPRRVQWADQSPKMLWRGRCGQVDVVFDSHFFGILESRIRVNTAARVQHDRVPTAGPNPVSWREKGQSPWGCSTRVEVGLCFGISLRSAIRRVSEADSCWYSRPATGFGNR